MCVDATTAKGDDFVTWLIIKKKVFSPATITYLLYRWGERKKKKIEKLIEDPRDR